MSGKPLFQVNLYFTKKKKSKFFMNRDQIKEVEDSPFFDNVHQR